MQTYRRYFDATTFNHTLRSKAKVISFDFNEMAASDESEWEYEYDENEMEDFYLTLDLTTHVPPVLTREKRSRAQKPTARGSNKSLANAPGVAGEQASDNENGNDNENQDENDNSAADGITEENRMQIVDLHAENPLISYNKAFYSCRWATELGTNLFLAPPPTTLDPNHMALRSTPSFDILGTTSARLVAVPANIRPRGDTIAVPEAPKERPLTGEQSYTTAEGDVIQSSETYGLRIELPSTASAARVSQAKFLESLSAIKARRGDRDAVPVTNVKTYHPPEGWQEERQIWITKETARSEKDKVEAATRMERLNKRPRYTRGDTQPDVQDVVEPEAQDADADAEDQEPTPSAEPPDSANTDPVALRAQAIRKRKARGGFRGGAPSGKRLRQSLGLPEARRDRDRKPRGRPPKKSVAVETASPEADVGEGASATAEQDVAGVTAEQVDVLLEGAEGDQDMTG